MPFLVNGGATAATLLAKDFCYSEEHWNPNMEAVTLQYPAHTSRAGYHRLGEVLLIMGHLQNALIRHRNSDSSTHHRQWNIKVQNAHLTDLHRHDPEYRSCARRLLEGMTRRVNLSFIKHFKDPANVGRPQTKSPYRNRTLEISEPSVSHLKVAKSRCATIHVKGLPTIRFRTDHRLPASAQPRTIRITRTPRRLLVSLVFQLEPVQWPEPARDSVGIDPGVKQLLTAVSDNGAVLQIPGLDDSQHRKAKRALLRKMQRQRDAALRDGRARFTNQRTNAGNLKRRFRWIGQPSKNYLKSLAQLRRVEQRRQDSRQGHQHRLTTQLVRDHHVICIEDTKTRNLTRSAKGTSDNPGRNVAQKRGLNRAIMSQGWYGIRQKLEYKSAWHGRIFVPAPAAYTSQCCSQCGHVAKENRRQQALFLCVNCGYPSNADINAAENIRRQGLALARAGNQPGRAA